MKHVLLLILSAFLFSCSSPQKQLDNVFYAFSNAGDLPNTPETLEEKVDLFKNLGFDGWGGHYGVDDNPARRKALEKAGLTFPEIYWRIDLDSAGNTIYKEGLEETIIDAKDRGLLVSVILKSEKFGGDRAEADRILASALGELADIAETYGAKVTIYPHFGTHCETIDHSLQLAKMVSRDNMGISFNLCHLLKSEGPEGWEQKLRNAFPYLQMISINGAETGNTQEMGWNELIQPLGEGTFDTYAVVKFAKDLGYEGPFGLQCYNIKQDAEVALTNSMNTWKEYQARYAE